MAIVYTHIRKDNNKVFYVGIGKTVARSKSKSNRNPYWHHIVNKHGYTIEVIHKNITWDEACTIEKQKIQEYGRADLQLGLLVNMTNGGEGIENVSTESKKLLSEQKVGNNNHRFGKFGDENYNSKLSYNDVKYIRENFIPHNTMFGIRALAKQFLVDRGTIKKVVEGKSYRNKDGYIIQSKKLDNTTTNNKFTPDDIKYIRNVYIPHHPEFGCKPLSVKFNTNETRIWKIVTRKVWKNI